MAKNRIRVQRSDADKAQIIQQIDAGVFSENAACRKLHIGHTTIEAWRKKLNLPRPPKGTKIPLPSTALAVTKPKPPARRETRGRKGGATTLTRAQKEAAVKEWKDGGNAAKIGLRIGVSAAAIYWWDKQMKRGWAAGNPYRRGGRRLVRKPQAGENGAGAEGRIPMPVTPRGKAVVAVASQRIHSATGLLRQVEARIMEDIRTGQIRRLSDHPDRVLSIWALTELMYGHNE